MQVDDFEHAWSVIDTDPVNQRWQEQMSSLFEPIADLEPGERFPMMREVFYLE
jgi:L-rhamnose mutarotase